MSHLFNDMGSLSADQKRLLLAQMLQKKAVTPTGRRVSLGQERLWLLTELNPESPLYNISVSYYFTGVLDLHALEQALRTVERRHDILRSTFRVVGGQIVQEIGPEAASLPIIEDLQGLPEGQRNARVEQIAAEEARTIFDLGKGPLWRIKLLRCSAHENVLIVTMHHIVSDGWSFSVFCQELTALYDAFREGKPSTLEDLPLQYADYSQRQRERLIGPAYEDQLAFWKEHLSGNLVSLRLPEDRQGSALSTRRGNRLPFTLPEELGKALDDLSRSESASLFMTLLAGFQALLYTYTQQEVLLISTPVTGRHRSQTRHLIGYFNNLLPMRFDLGDDPTLLDLVRRTRGVSLDAFKNQDIPCSDIVNGTGLRHVASSRLLFSLDMEWPPVLPLAGLETRARDVDTGALDFDLAVSIWEQEGRLKGVIKYKADLFEEATVAALITRYESLLGEFVANPHRTISSLARHEVRENATLSAPIVEKTAGYVAPRTPSEFRVATEWEEVLGIRPIGVQDDLLTLGVSSLTIARLSERLQKTFDARLPLVAVFQARTVEQFAALLETRGTSLPASPLVPIQPKGTQPPLFLCEGLGIYFPLIRYLGNDQPVYGLVTEVVENFPTVEELAKHYLQEIRAIQPEGPYRVGGASFGGLVAFEIAQQLYASGQQVSLLALLDTPTPWAYRTKSFSGKLAGHLGNLLKFGIPYARKKLGWEQPTVDRNPGEQVDLSPLSQSRIANGVRRLFEERAAKYDVVAYPGVVTLFALANRDAMTDSLFDPALLEIDPGLGWGRVAAGGVEILEVPGEHISMFQEPHVLVLGDALKSCLAKAASGQVQTL